MSQRIPITGTLGSHVTIEMDGCLRMLTLHEANELTARLQKSVKEARHFQTEQHHIQKEIIHASHEKA